MTPVWRIGHCPSPVPSESALLAPLGDGSTLGMTRVSAVTSLGLWVPSFVEPGEHNLLLNPAHPAYRAVRLTIERQPFQFDPRLF